MVQVIVFYSVLPIFESPFTTLFSKVRENVLKEDGCIQYELFVSPFNPLRFCLVEKWVSQTALDAHLTTKHMADYFAQSRDFFTDKPIIEIKDIVNERYL